MFVGWDWASTTHDVTVIDDAGAVLTTGHRPTPRPDWPTRSRGWPVTASPTSCRWRSSSPAGWSWTGCWPPATPWCRSTPARSTLPGPAGRGGCQVRTLATATSWPTTCAPTGTGCAGSNPSIQGCGSCRPWSGCVRIMSVLAPPPATNWGRCWTPTGPDPRRCSPKLASDIALAFLTDYPTPQSAARLGQARLAAFCRRHAYRGGKPPAELLARLRAAPIPPVGLSPAVLAQLVTAQVQLLRSLQATIGELETAIKQRVAQHPRAKLLSGLPGVGTINLAQLLAEVGPILDRVSNAEQAAAECGAAPVTRASGKTSGVYFRWAANPRARTALTAFAHNARMQSPWAGQLYADARARGKRNPHATRIVARAWLRVIWAC